GYMRFVIIIAKEYIYSNNKLTDLIASGNQGLTKAVESFDCTKNISFAILAEWLIRQEILKKI
ncbi:MAG: RNA polymerase sigma factor RpoD, partial [Ruminococcus sp.]|nr:RNA polymerase sigma factor RpoD [Ruminococcus sp.]